MNSTKFNNNYKDACIFDSICGNDLKKEVANNVKSSMKSDSVDISLLVHFVMKKMESVIGLWCMEITDLRGR